MARPAISERQREAMRARIREATLQLARRRGILDAGGQGWESITIREVAREAGISVGTFYKYFADRAELGEALWAEPVERLRRAISEIFEQEADPLARLRKMLARYARFALENRALFRSVFLHVRPAEAERPPRRALEEEEFFRLLRATLEEGQRRGQMCDFDPRVMAQLIWAGLHGSLALPENLDRLAFDSPEALAEAMIHALVALVARRPE